MHLAGQETICTYLIASATGPQIKLVQNLSESLYLNVDHKEFKKDHITVNG